MLNQLAAWYFPILWVHIGAAIVSGSLFAMRGGLVLSGRALGNHRTLRTASSTVDTVLLLAGVLLSFIIREYPFVEAWLTVKVALLALYIVLGSFTLRHGSTPTVRAQCFVGAIVVYLFIVSIAYTQSPWGAFAWIA